MSRYGLYLCLWLALPALATICEERPIERRFELGISLQTLLAEALPDFANGSPAYGLNLRAPVWRGSIELSGNYNSSSQFHLHAVELGYRQIFTVPFFSFFVGAGGYMMRYGMTTTSHARYGPYGSLGFVLPLSRSFHVWLGLKGYVATQSIVGLGGGFSFLL